MIILLMLILLQFQVKEMNQLNALSIYTQSLKNKRYHYLQHQFTNGGKIDLASFYQIQNGRIIFTDNYMIYRKDRMLNQLDLKPIQIKTQVNILAPLESVSAGFPSPAQDYMTDAIDLNKLLIHNAKTTFILRVSSLSMKDAGIDIGDQILIDRSLDVEHGDIILALVNNEFTVKRFMKEKNQTGEYKIWLKAENADFSNIFLQDEEQLTVWGVVTCILKKLR